MAAKDAGATEPKGITGTDALTRCLNILEHVDDDGSGDQPTVTRVIKALAAYYGVELSAGIDPDERRD